MCLNYGSLDSFRGSVGFFLRTSRGVITRLDDDTRCTNVIFAAAACRYRSLVECTA